MDRPQLPLFEIPEASNAFAPDSQLVVHAGDAHAFLRTIPTATAQLIF